MPDPAPPKKKDDAIEKMNQAVDDFLKDSRELRQMLDQRTAKLNGNGKWRIFG